MAGATKVTAVDGQLVPFSGIHPFYLDMTFVEFLKTLIEWKVVSVVVNQFGNADVVLRRNRMEIVLTFKDPDLDPSLGPLGFRHLGGIYSENAFVKDGRKLSTLSVAQLQKITGVEMSENQELSTIDLELDINIKAYTEKSNDENRDLGFFISETDGYISSISISKTVKGTYLD